MNRVSVAAVVLLVGMSGCGAADPPADDGGSGIDKACADPWSLVHVASGALLSNRLGPDSFEQCVAAVVGWEVIEPWVWPNWYETSVNQGCDVIAGVVGWLWLTAVQEAPRKQICPSSGEPGTEATGQESCSGNPPTVPATPVSEH
ncbi:MAG: hypothetical protein JSV19_00260 [Phycisphaerales bacterium]|nr:MAG: hypothetical protein JSV19_00260 [Phycisphaerales bacterium]